MLLSFGRRRPPFDRNEVLLEIRDQLLGQGEPWIELLVLRHVRPAPSRRPAAPGVVGGRDEHGRNRCCCLLDREAACSLESAGRNRVPPSWRAGQRQHRIDDLILPVTVTHQGAHSMDRPLPDATETRYNDSASARRRLCGRTSESLIDRQVEKGITLAEQVAYLGARENPEILHLGFLSAVQGAEILRR